MFRPLPKEIIIGITKNETVYQTKTHSYQNYKPNRPFKIFHLFKLLFRLVLMEQFCSNSDSIPKIHLIDRNY